MAKQVEKVKWHGCICGKAGILMENEVHRDDDPARCALALFAALHGYKLNPPQSYEQRTREITTAHREKLNALEKRIEALEQHK